MASRYADDRLVKFLQRAGAFWDRATQIAHNLGLTGIRRLKILDIGCGVPFFGRVCRDFGHIVVNLNSASSLLDEAAPVLGESYVSHYIRRYQTIPGCKGPFDLITMFGVNLRFDDEHPWTWKEWGWLLQDLWSRMCVGGRIVLRPNIHPNYMLLFDTTNWHREFGSELKLLTVTDHNLQITAYKDEPED